MRVGRIQQQSNNEMTAQLEYFYELLAVLRIYWSISICTMQYPDFLQISIKKWKY